MLVNFECVNWLWDRLWMLLAGHVQRDVETKSVWNNIHMYIHIYIYIYIFTYMHVCRCGMQCLLSILWLIFRYRVDIQKFLQHQTLYIYIYIYIYLFIYIKKQLYTLTKLSLFILSCNSSLCELVYFII